MRFTFKILYDYDFEKRKAINRFAIVSLGIWLFFAPLTATAQVATTAGDPICEYPTFENLSVSWPIQGDKNENGVVKVRYRKADNPEWRTGLPLRRVPAGSNCGFPWPNRHAGSLFGLEPNTQYQIELKLHDPDGGSVKRTISARTARTIALPNKGKLVDSDSLKTAILELVPGQVLLLDEGTYDGFQINCMGTSDKPIVIRANTPRTVSIQSDIVANGCAHIQIEGLDVQGKIKFNNSKHILIQNCKVHADRDGIVAYGPKTACNTVLGNVLHGPNRWDEAAAGAKGDNFGEGIVMTGPGHVIAYNYVEGFRDGISLVEDDGAFEQVSVDIYRNDIYRCCDDGIEADFSMGNVRVYENRLTDCFMGISSQPSLGGPTYMIRNVFYNPLIQAFKLQRSSVGDIGFHNTVVKAGDAFSVNTEDVWSHSQFFNNLFIGGPGSRINGYPSGTGKVQYLPSADPNCHFDFNGYGSIDTGGFFGQRGKVKFSTFEDFQKRFGETNSLQVDLSVFKSKVTVPVNPFTKHSPVDLRLASNAKALDRGLKLPNINDAFRGSSPDLGAYELGDGKQNYGPSAMPKFE